MIEQVTHPVSGTDPAGLALALAVAYALHAPAPRTRAAEVATGATRPARTRRRRPTRA
ncbi:hypothetical protein ACWC10_26575 [Streptomyces sp. NPDC001595]|uniref:hypothetical protein n=1 Tax=Streptomyces sp. NPDC001532 TaxID=3154520 RepID=UPI00331B2691